jgi:hypothetical protein
MTARRAGSAAVRSGRGGGAGRRRVGAAGLAAGLAMVALAPPAAAGPPGETASASAFWVLSDARSTAVSLQATTAPVASEPASLFVFVTQRYCDAAADETVFRSFSAGGTLDNPGSFRVHALLKSALLRSSATLSGFEQRYASCASPTVFVSTTTLGSEQVELAVTWAGRGDAYEVQPGITGRDAEASGSITGGALAPGSLGTSQVAQLRSQTA